MNILYEIAKTIPIICCIIIFIHWYNNVYAYTLNDLRSIFKCLQQTI